MEAVIVKKHKKVIREYSEKFSKDTTLDSFKNAEKVLKVKIDKGENKYDIPTIEELLIDRRSYQYNV